MENRNVVVKTDWDTSEMPLLHIKFKIKKHFTAEQMACLRYGHIPQEMEDKWFWYMEGNNLYAHRSWTGFCIFILTFYEGHDKILVTVNRNPKQYEWTSIKNDKETINSLLNWWCQENYDYYHEWLSETFNATNRPTP